MTGALALAATLVLALAGPAAAPAGAKVPKTFVGMTPTDFTPYDGVSPHRSAELAAMSKAGVGVIRQSIDVPRGLANLDDDVLDAARHRITVLPLLLDGSRLKKAQGRNHGFFPPRSNATFAREVATLVRRYGHNGTLWRGPNAKLRKYAITTWQVWNEPNLPVFWQPRPSARAYVKLLAATSKAIHGADRRASVVSAGIPNSTQSKPLGYTAYLKAFLKAGGGRYVDALGVHAYSRSAKQFTSLLRTFRHVLDTHRARRLKLWITEVGWADAGPRSSFVIGSKGQQRAIKGAYAAVRASRGPLRIAGIMYYQWRDYSPPAGRADTWGFHTGLFKRNGQAKAAFGVWRKAVRALER